MQFYLASRVVGFVASLVLTLAAFFLIVRPEYFHFKPETAVIAIFILAVLQFTVQSVCFLSIWNEKGPRWNLFIFFSTLTIILIIIVFSIWVMGHLDANMMPM